MSRRRTAPPKDPINLGLFKEPRKVFGDSHWWHKITEFQRAGHVSLTWGDTKDFCTVTITQAGLAALEAEAAESGH